MFAKKSIQFGVLPIRSNLGMEDLRLAGWGRGGKCGIDVEIIEFDFGSFE